MLNNYQDFKIEIDLDRQQMTNNLGIVTTYRVSKPDFECYFIFGDGLLAAMSNQDMLEDEYEEMQFERIKEKIDAGELDNFEEYIFQYYGGNNYLEENNVNWWKKTLRDTAKARGLIE